MLLLSIPLLLGACGLFSDSIPLSTVGFQVDNGANGDAPVPVDVVLISSSDLTPTLLALTAAEWFGRKAQLLRDSPETLRVQSFELVPGSTIAPQRINRRPRPVAALVFANYQTPGAHRLRLVTQDEAIIRLGTRDLLIAPTGDSK